MNTEDQKKSKEIIATYDNSAVVIRELAEEVVNVTAKYGTESALTKKKTHQLNVLKNLYDETIDYINFLRELNNKQHNDMIIADLLHQSQETGMPEYKILQLAGHNDKQVAHLKKLDDIINHTKSVLKIVDNPNDKLELLINRLKGGE